MGSVVSIRGEMRQDLSFTVTSRGVTKFGDTYCIGKTSNGVKVEVEACHGGASLICRGTLKALMESGYLTRSMIERRAAKNGRNAPNNDEDGGRFLLSRSPTKREPARMKLTRGLDANTAIGLPGMREMFPEGIPKPTQVEPSAGTGPATAQEFKGRLLYSLDLLLSVQACTSTQEWRGLSRSTGPRFRLADADIQRMESKMDRFKAELFAALEESVVIDDQAPKRPSGLRLVVNNTH
jgi:hypothetical protein